MAKKGLSAKMAVKGLFSKSEANLKDSVEKDDSSKNTTKVLKLFKWKKKKRTAEKAGSTAEETQVFRAESSVSVAAQDEDGREWPNADQKASVYATAPRSKKGLLSFSETDLRKPKRFGTFSFGLKSRKKRRDWELSQSTTGLQNSGSGVTGEGSQQEEYDEQMDMTSWESEKIPLNRQVRLDGPEQAAESNSNVPLLCNSLSQQNNTLTNTFLGNEAHKMEKTDPVTASITPSQVENTLASSRDSSVTKGNRVKMPMTEPYQYSSVPASPDLTETVLLFTDKPPRSSIHCVTGQSVKLLADQAYTPGPVIGPAFDSVSDAGALPGNVGQSFAVVNNSFQNNDQSLSFPEPSEPVVDDSKTRNNKGTSQDLDDAVPPKNVPKEDCRYPDCTEVPILSSKSNTVIEDILVSNLEIPAMNTDSSVLSEGTAITVTPATPLDIDSSVLSDGTGITVTPATPLDIDSSVFSEGTGIAMTPATPLDIDSSVFSDGTGITVTPVTPLDIDSSVWSEGTAITVTPATPLDIDSSVFSEGTGITVTPATPLDIDSSVWSEGTGITVTPATPLDIDSSVLSEGTGITVTPATPLDIDSSVWSEGTGITVTPVTPLDSDSSVFSDGTRITVTPATPLDIGSSVFSEGTGIAMTPATPLDIDSSVFSDGTGITVTPVTPLDIDSSVWSEGTGITVTPATPLDIDSSVFSEGTGITVTPATPLDIDSSVWSEGTGITVTPATPLDIDSSVLSEGTGITVTPATPLDIDSSVWSEGTGITVTPATPLDIDSSVLSEGTGITVTPATPLDIDSSVWSEGTGITVTPVTPLDIDSSVLSDGTRITVTPATPLDIGSSVFSEGTGIAMTPATPLDIGSSVFSDGTGITVTPVTPLDSDSSVFSDGTGITVTPATPLDIDSSVLSEGTGITMTPATPLDIGSSVFSDGTGITVTPATPLDIDSSVFSDGTGITVTPVTPLDIDSSVFSDGTGITVTPATPLDIDSSVFSEGTGIAMTPATPLDIDSSVFSEGTGITMTPATPLDIDSSVFSDGTGITVTSATRLDIASSVFSDGTGITMTPATPANADSSLPDTNAVISKHAPSLINKANLALLSLEDDSSLVISLINTGTSDTSTQVLPTSLSNLSETAFEKSESNDSVSVASSYSETDGLLLTVADPDQPNPKIVEPVYHGIEPVLPQSESGSVVPQLSASPETDVALTCDPKVVSCEVSPRDLVNIPLRSSPLSGSMQVGLECNTTDNDLSNMDVSLQSDNYADQCEQVTQIQLSSSEDDHSTPLINVSCSSVLEDPYLNTGPNEPTQLFSHSSSTPSETSRVTSVAHKAVFDILDPQPTNQTIPEQPSSFLIGCQEGGMDTELLGIKEPDGRYEEHQTLVTEDVSERAKETIDLKEDLFSPGYTLTHRTMKQSEGEPKEQEETEYKGLSFQARMAVEQSVTRDQPVDAEAQKEASKPAGREPEKCISVEERERDRVGLVKVSEAKELQQGMKDKTEAQDAVLGMSKVLKGEDLQHPRLSLNKPVPPVARLHVPEEFEAVPPTYKGKELSLVNWSTATHAYSGAESHPSLSSLSEITPWEDTETFTISKSAERAENTQDSFTHKQHIAEREDSAKLCTVTTGTRETTINSTETLGRKDASSTETENTVTNSIDSEQRLGHRTKSVKIEDLHHTEEDVSVISSTSRLAGGIGNNTSSQDSVVERLRNTDKAQGCVPLWEDYFDRKRVDFTEADKVQVKTALKEDTQPERGDKDSDTLSRRSDLWLATGDQSADSFQPPRLWDSPAGLSTIIEEPNSESSQAGADPGSASSMNSDFEVSSTTFSLRHSSRREDTGDLRQAHKMSLFSGSDVLGRTESREDSLLSHSGQNTLSEANRLLLNPIPDERGSSFMENPAESPSFPSSRYQSAMYISHLRSPRTLQEAETSESSLETAGSLGNSSWQSHRSEVQAGGRDWAELVAPAREREGEREQRINTSLGSQTRSDFSQDSTETDDSFTGVFTATRVVLLPSPTDSEPDLEAASPQHDMDTLVDTLKSMDRPVRQRGLRGSVTPAFSSLPPIEEDGPSPTSSPKSDPKSTAALAGQTSELQNGKPSIPSDLGLGLKWMSQKEMRSPLAMMKEQQSPEQQGRNPSLPLRASAISSIVMRKGSLSDLSPEEAKSPTLSNGSNGSAQSPSRLENSFLYSSYRSDAPAENGLGSSLGAHRPLFRASSLPETPRSSNDRMSAPLKTLGESLGSRFERLSFLSPASSLNGAVDTQRISRPPPLIQHSTLTETPLTHIHPSPPSSLELFRTLPTESPSTTSQHLGLQRSLSNEGTGSSLFTDLNHSFQAKEEPVQENNLLYKYRAFPDAYLTKEKEHGKLNPRPGKMFIYDRPGFNGQRFEIRGDVVDATSWQLPETISIRVVRGGWVLYEKPNFKGEKFALDEGDIELKYPFGPAEEESSGQLVNGGQESVTAETDRPEGTRNFVIGSIRRAVRDYSVPEICLFPEENAEGKKVVFRDTSEDARIFGFPIKANSIIINAGLWLVFAEPFFQGVPRVLEVGGFPNPAAWGVTQPYVASLHPLKIGEPRVEKPQEPKIIIYDKPYFTGKSREIYTNMRDFMTRHDRQQTAFMYSAASIKVIGGCWVGYEKEGFRGHQYLLEEGEYHDWRVWGGCDSELRSVRVIRADFSEPMVVLCEMPDEEVEGEEEQTFEVTEAIPDVELFNFRITTRSIHVLSGVWIAYSHVDYSGNQYVLEKGFYNNCADWGAKDNRICSLQPVLQTFSEDPCFKNEVLLYPEPDFQGPCQVCAEDMDCLPDGLVVKSCRVVGGSWVLYEGQKFTGNQYVLSEGDYPNFVSIGCQSTSVFRSVKAVPIMFSVPSISLFGLECLEGREVTVNTEVHNMLEEGFNNHFQSVRVNSGCWVIFEHNNYRGRQFLLEPIEITNWHKFSQLHYIGSMYPVKQRRRFFRIKNKAQGYSLSVQGGVEDMKSGRVVVAEQVDGMTDVWFYEDGLIRNKMAANMSLQVMGNVESGAKVVLWSDTRTPIQTWAAQLTGPILSLTFPGMRLDVKGGKAYDKEHVVIREEVEDKVSQQWELELL